MKLVALIVAALCFALAFLLAGGAFDTSSEWFAAQPLGYFGLFSFVIAFLVPPS